MHIKSTLLPPERGVLPIALETCFGDKRLFVGIGLGHVRRGELELSDAGEACFRRLADCSRKKRPDGAIHIVAIEHFRRVRSELREALGHADDGDMVFLVCPDGSIYDALFVQLNIVMRAGVLATH